MRRFLRYLLLKPVLWAAKKFSSRPERQRIFPALDKLYEEIIAHPGKKGIVIPFEERTGKFIIFSDQHKGGKDGADDFVLAEPNYMQALEYYNTREFSLICLGDCEELWENTLSKVKDSYPQTFEAEKKFIGRKAFIKILGNHDLYWGNDPFAWWQLEKIYGEKLKVYEGVVLSVNLSGRPFRILCTHGHQGDAQSDGNWFSKFFVARIWAPFQAYLRINPNTAAYNNEKKSLHNEIMYEWSAVQKDTLLITGHTHQPVFVSLTHIERLYREFQYAKKNDDNTLMQTIEAEIRKREQEFAAVAIDYLTMKPSYFNSGCCCFIDGDITGIEIENGQIRLIKWSQHDKNPGRQVLEEMALAELASAL
ncbi:MAG: metallophosphoesterase [Chitinophagaceae bacterium]|nr:MAG: metallophosphoesterase [Chitinophagaceae bacterium]